MKISAKGRYALRIMADIALNDKDEYVSIKDISVRQEISPKYLEQIISKLTKADFVKSTRGAQGGYQLSKKPSEYKIGDILRVTEGPISTVSCIDGKNKCANCKKCLTVQCWENLNKLINNYLDSITLQDILDKNL